LYKYKLFPAPDVKIPKLPVESAKDPFLEKELKELYETCEKQKDRDVCTAEL
jgi:hypothetical protein